MRLGKHTLSRTEVEAIADPGGSGHAIKRLVAAERSKHMLLVRAVLDMAAASPAAARASAAYDVLAEVGRIAPHAADAVVSSPAVGAWGLRLLRRNGSGGLVPPGRAGTQAADGLAAVAAAAAILGQVDCQVQVPVKAGAVPKAMLPTVGYATFVDVSNVVGAAVLRIDARGTRLTCGGSQTAIPANPRMPAVRWHPVPAISVECNSRALTVLVDAQSPYRRPGHVTEPGRLLSTDIQAWRKVIVAGWQILACHHPATAAEVSEVISVLTPLKAPAGTQFSITARESFGAVALSLPTDDLTMAVTFAHEVQHTKLMALDDMFPLLYQPDRRMYYAPWRDDPRPLSGLLQGAFAYFGVASFWRRQRLCETSHTRALRAHTEFARWRVAALDVAGVLGRSRALTSPGQLVVDVMQRNLEQWCTEPVPDQALLAARAAATLHRVRWLRQHGDDI